MGIKDGTIEFKLSRPLEFKVNGGSDAVDCVTLREPGMEHVKFYLRLKQMITRSQMELAKQAGAIKDMQESIGEEIKPITKDVKKLESETDAAHEMFSLALQASETVDLGAFIGTFEKMVCTRANRAIVMINDRQVMTKPIWTNLRPEDAFNMAIRWCAFFGTPSTEGEKTILDRPSDSPTEPTEA